MSPRGGVLTYAWQYVSGAGIPDFSVALNVYNPTVNISFPDYLGGGNWTFRAIVSDGQDVCTREYEINVTDRCPVIIITSSPTGQINQTSYLDATASWDPQNRTLNYTWEQIGGPLVDLLPNNSSANVTFVPNDEQIGSLHFTLWLANVECNVTRAVEIFIYPATLNFPPYVSPPSILPPYPPLHYEPLPSNTTNQTAIPTPPSNDTFQPLPPVGTGPPPHTNTNQSELFPPWPEMTTSEILVTTILLAASLSTCFLVLLFVVVDNRYTRKDSDTIYNY
jgi:hypothetical protein